MNYERLISEIRLLLGESNQLINKELIKKSEIVSFKKKSAVLFVRIIKQDISEVVSEIAESGLSYQVSKIGNPVLRWLFDRLIFKIAMSYNAPFLVKHSDTDYYKRYIFWTAKKLNGILYNLERLNKA